MKNTFCFWAIAVALLVGFCASQVMAQPPSITSVEKGTFTVRVRGSGYPPGATVEIASEDGTPLWQGKADSNGNIDENIPNTTGAGGAIQAGGKIITKDGGTTGPATAVKVGTVKSYWNLIVGGGAEVGTNLFSFEGGLSATGFSGTIDLVSVSSNSLLISDVTTYDSILDEMTTTGSFQGLSPGQVIGDYVAQGTFTNLRNPDTGALITSGTLYGQALIGEVVPEPSTFSIVVVGLAVLGFFAKLKR